MENEIKAVTVNQGLNGWINLTVIVNGKLTTFTITRHVLAALIANGATALV